MNNLSVDQNNEKKDRLLPSPYDSTLALGAEIDLADQRYRNKGGSLQHGFVERDALFIFTYGRSAEEEQNADLIRSRARLGLLGVPLLAGSNGIVLYNGSIGRPIRTSMNFFPDSKDRLKIKDKIIRLKHERYPEFRYSVEPFNISYLAHPDIPMSPELLAVVDELTNTRRVSINNLRILSLAIKTISQQYEPVKDWNYKELWLMFKNKIKNDLENRYSIDTEEMIRAKKTVFAEQLKWMEEMEEFSGLMKKRADKDADDGGNGVSESE